MNLNYYYWWFKEAIPANVCDAIIKHGNSKQEQLALTGGQTEKIEQGKDLTEEDLKDLKKKRDSNVVWLNDEWIYKEIEEKVGPHDGIIYIRCDPQISYNRVKIRSRTEENLIPIEYLEKIHKYHDEWLINNNNVIVIDVNNDFENNEKELEIIINKISEFIDKIFEKNKINSEKNTTTNCSIN